MTMGYDDICGLDECPFEIVVGLFAHATVACLTTAGMDLGHDAGIGGQVASSGEAIDDTDLALDDDGEDVTHTGDGFQQLHVGCELDALEYAFFERGDLLHGGIEEIEHLIKTATCFRRELLDSSVEPCSAFADEDIAVLGSVEGVLGEG